MNFSERISVGKFTIVFVFAPIILSETVPSVFGIMKTLSTRDGDFTFPGNGEKSFAVKYT